LGSSKAATGTRFAGSDTTVCAPLRAFLAAAGALAAWPL
jgi:hypothetical protein